MVVARASPTGDEDEDTASLLPAGNAPLVVFSALGNSPVVRIDAQAPTLQLATRLIDVNSRSLREFVVQLTKEQRTPLNDQIRLRQLGSATGSVSAERAAKAGVVRDAVLLWLFLMGLVLLRDFLVQQSRRERAEDRSDQGLVHAAASQ